MRFLFFILFFSFSASANVCRFQDQLGKGGVVSLSGPLTHALFELGLLADKKLKAISVFNGFGAQDFKGEILSGGIFLSQTIIQKYAQALVFYDESVDLRKKFADWPKGRAIEIPSRGLNPFQVQAEVMKALHPFLQDCGEAESKLAAKLALIDQNWRKSSLKDFPVFFFMGKVAPGEKLPDLVIRDGFVLYLHDLGKIQTYPSTLFYIAWSAKILKQWEKKGMLKLGLAEGEELSYEGSTVYGPTLFIPGIPQIYLLQKLQSILEKHHALKGPPPHSP